MPPIPPIQPSDLYPALTWENLIALRTIFWETRRWVADDAKPERGDDRTAVGYRAWAHARFEVTKAAINRYSEWLSVKHGGAYFVFKVKMLPVRFCRADAEEALPPKYRYAAADEAGDVQQATEREGTQPIDGIFRIVTEANSTGHPVGVYLVFADPTGETKYAWKIPESLADDGTSPIVVPTAPITLGPLTVKSNAEVEAEREEAAQKNAEAKATRKKGA